MTLYAYDTEFLEDGRTVELISIGIVCEDGREYYAVNADAPWKRIREHDWLRKNVVPSLPQIRGDRRHYLSDRDLGVDFGHPAVKKHTMIGTEVRDFLLGGATAPELWANYGAYDHVVLAQLWGRMIDLPAGVPMFTNDIQQEAASHHLHIPEQLSGAHNALEDARHVMRVLREEWGYVR